MSLALIEESAKEVRRLAIAGSPLAVGDFRLKKLILPLEQAGAKAPVFSQAAKAVQDLVVGTEAESATRLLTLSTLLNAILYTQGQTGAVGEFQKIESFPAKCITTRTPARVLKPLIEALSASGAGRVEVVRAAVERGAFDDLRLIDPAVRALGDTYAELADLVAEEVLPGYGPGIIPRLKATFDLNGRKQDARKLQVMHRLDPAGTLDLCRNALAEGSFEVKIAAIACLGEHVECLPPVLGLINAKNNNLRAAALRAIARHETPETTKVFTELIENKAYDTLAGLSRKMQNGKVLNLLLKEAQSAFNSVLKKGKEQIPDFCEVYNCLRPRLDPGMEEFLIGCFAHAGKLARMKGKKGEFAGPEVLSQFVHDLYAFETPRAQETLLERLDQLPAVAFRPALRCALGSWTPDKVFKTFSPLLNPKTDEENEKLQELVAAVCNSNGSTGILVRGSIEDFSDGPLKDLQWDERWIDAAIKADHLGIVCCLARPGHKGLVAYLLKLAAARNFAWPALVVRALADCRHPEVTDVFLQLLAGRIKGKKGAAVWCYEMQTLLECAQVLPAADLPKLDAFAAKLDEQFVDKYLEALAPLRKNTGAPA